LQCHYDPLHQVLKDLYYFILFLTSSPLLLYQINDHDDMKDHVALVFEGFNTHEIHDVELIHQILELLPHTHIHLRSRVRVESVLQGIRD
jgi:Ni,Fe-hydrogenase I cytochrome b subunit